MMETDLFKPVQKFLVENGYEVRSEIKNCDIAAIKEGKLLVVELKLNMTVELFAQAVDRQRFADLVYIAVPKPKKFVVNQKWKRIFHLIRRLEIGLLFVSIKGDNDMVEVIAEPIEFDRGKSISGNKKKREGLLKEFSGRKTDMNIGGSRGKKLVTAYRERAILIASLLEKEGEASAKRLKELGTDENKTGAILRDNVYGWFEKVDKGVYRIADKWNEERELYSELISMQR